MTLKKIVGKLHLWLGLSSGIVVFILGITGCIYAFIEEIEPLVYKHRLYVEPQSTPKKPMSEIWQAAQNAIGTENKLMGASVPNTPHETCSFTIYKAKENSDAVWYWQDIELYRTVYVNPYTAEVVTNEDKTFEFFEFVVNLHWSLLLTNEIGQPIVGVATLIFVISLISGLILWWPKNKAASKQRFWFKWKNTTRWKRKNYDLHNITGFYVFLIALIFGLTGLVWTFDWFDESVQWIANGGVSHEHDQPMKSDTTKYASAKTSLDQLFVQVQNEYPKAKRYFVSKPADSSGVINVFISNSRFDYCSNQYDQYTGKLLKSETFADENNGHKLRSMNYDIHTGGIAGLPGKILAFIGSLICASLPVTGFYIWWGRHKKQKRST
ncbi:MAG: PepSY domain-containing protein [Chitinophagaceae bacterium]|nr:PepSY domain-containing protein [Chitinophagaceae bacterium]